MITAKFFDPSQGRRHSLDPKTEVGNAANQPGDAISDAAKTVGVFEDGFIKLGESEKIPGIDSLSSENAVDLAKKQR